MEESGSSFRHQRLESLDALRGFDMFWIIGAEGLVLGLRRLSDSTVVAVVSDQLEHVPWEGFHAYDLIFPLFVFLMGVSTVFSLSRFTEEAGVKAAYPRVIRRFIVLYLLGLVYYGGLSRGEGPEMFRYLGVLQRISLCYLFGAICFLHLKPRGLLVALVLLLVGYWVLLTFVPVPGCGAGVYEEGMNLTNYLDSQFLPGYKWDGDWDPEGILSTLPAIGTGLLGIFAGLLLRRPDLAENQRTVRLVVLGLVCLAVSYLWGLQFPVIKKLWTSTFVLAAGGWSFLLLACFYQVIDVWGFKGWSRPFVWIGMNSITIYILSNLVGGFHSLARRIIHQPLEDALGAWGDLTIEFLGLLLAIIFCGYLYRHRFFLRV